MDGLRSCRPTLAALFHVHPWSATNLDPPSECSLTTVTSSVATYLFASHSILVGAGSTLVLDQDETLAIADRLGVFVVAVDLPWIGPPNG